MCPANERPTVTRGFKIVERARPAEGLCVLRVTGQLDIDGSSILQEAFVELLEQGVQTVHLECADLRFISSVGVGVLIVAVGDFRNAGGDLEIRGLNADLRQIFEMLDLTDYVTLR